MKITLKLGDCTVSTIESRFPMCPLPSRVSLAMATRAKCDQIGEFVGFQIGGESVVGPNVVYMKPLPEVGSCLHTCHPTVLAAVPISLSHGSSLGLPIWPPTLPRTSRGVARVVGAPTMGIPALPCAVLTRTGCPDDLRLVAGEGRPAGQTRLCAQGGGAPLAPTRFMLTGGGAMPATTVRGPRCDHFKDLPTHPTRLCDPIGGRDMGGRAQGISRRHAEAGAVPCTVHSVGRHIKVRIAGGAGDGWHHPNVAHSQSLTHMEVA